MWVCVDNCLLLVFLLTHAIYLVVNDNLNSLQVRECKERLFVCSFILSVITAVHLAILLFQSYLLIAYSN